MNLSHTLLSLLVILGLAACSAHTGRTPADSETPDAAQVTEQELATAQQRQALLQDTQHVTPCLHLQYRNPVVDRIEIKGGLRGGVYTPTHYEWVVYHSGAWEVVDSAGSRQSAVPRHPLGCLPPAAAPWRIPEQQ
jgi:outer membrane biogenesis lipoprotein LolB